MCTVSWLHQTGGYQLFCNRDERHTRPPATVPTLREQNGVQYYAPHDGEHGGTWLGVNQFGLTLCLLNGELNGESRLSSGNGKTVISRGLLLNQLLACRTLAQVQLAATQLDLSWYQPFILLALEAVPPALVLQWTGRVLTQAAGTDALPLLTSSSFDWQGAQIARRQHLSKLAAEASRLDAQPLYTFHTSHAPAASAYSTCMHRADASTVSFSIVRVEADTTHFFYASQPPCQLPSRLHQLPLAQVLWLP
jgi:hypothetical protein